MRMTRNPRRLRLRLTLKHCVLCRHEIEAMEDGLGSLEFAVASFPFADLSFTVTYQSRAQEYHVQARLRLPGRTLLTGEHDALVLPAYERGVRKLVFKVESYQDQIRRGISGLHAATEQVSSATNGDFAATLDRALRRACDLHDFRSFRAGLTAYDARIRQRVGRWVRRYSEFKVADAGETAPAPDTLPIDDLVEEVVLAAFERYPSKPTAMRPDDWIESLIDPAMRSVLRHPEEELEAIGFARTLREMHDELWRQDDGEEFDAADVHGEPVGGGEPFVDRSDLFRRPR